MSSFNLKICSIPHFCIYSLSYEIKKNGSYSFVKISPRENNLFYSASAED